MLVRSRKAWFNGRMKVEEAITQFGSVAALATALGISVQAVYQWGDTVPPLRVYQIRELVANNLAAPVDCSKEAA